MTSIALIKNTKSAYGVLASFTKSLEEAYERAGFRVISFDFTKDSEGEILALFAKELPEYTVGYNVLSEHLAFELLGIPHIALMVDHAPHHPSLLRSKGTRCGFMDQDSCQLFTSLGHPQVFFCPHAIDRRVLDRDISGERDLDVVLSGGYSDPQDILDIWDELFSKKAKQILLDMAEDVCQSPSFSHMQALVEEVERGGTLAQEIAKKGISGFELMNWLELYIRGIDRIRFIQALRGVDIHIFGACDDWKKVLGTKKRLFFHEAVSYDRLPEVFLRAKCVLNSMPTIKRGLHERLLLALACGATVLGNDTVLLSTTFPQNRAILQLLAPHYERANDLLSDCFQNEKMRLADVEATRSLLHEQHTFDARVTLLTNYYTK